jgi:NAD(P)-dependent dehydrogenase (short-subunit alcohol dehydrogenase family)
MATPLMRTPQGWEMQFATNHLGHFALATGLHDALAAAGAARIVSVSSVGHINGNIDFDDIHFQRRPYDPWQAYGPSKTANVLFAVEASTRWAADGIAANALNPGRIPVTNLSRHVGDVSNAPASFEPNSTAVSWKNPEQGAATSVLLAASPLLDGTTRRLAAARRYYSPPRRCSTVSAAATSRTATRPSRTSPASAAVSPRTPSTPRQRPGCGRFRSTPSPVSRRSTSSRRRAARMRYVACLRRVCGGS